MRTLVKLCLLATVLGFTGVMHLHSGVLPLPEQLRPPQNTASYRQVRDRTGRPLVASFDAGWNIDEQRSLHTIPPLLVQAFIQAEDRRFYSHRGVDWFARLHATWQNARAMRVVRGASTISEQVIRMLHPRIRSIPSRIREGIEAKTLEQRFSKADILEFYLNQVPFARQRRGVVQAARLYFDRDLETLTHREIVALAVLVRAPDRLDLFKNRRGMDRSVNLLAQRLHQIGSLRSPEYQRILEETLSPSSSSVAPRAPHFVRYVRKLPVSISDRHGIITTLDPLIQQRSQDILDSRVSDLSSKLVSDGAALVVDVRSAEVLAWVNAGGYSSEPGSHIDAVTTPRQPGSTLKPFLYALALEKGWSAATLIDDSPLAEPIGAGLHTYRNYSKTHYGKLPLRDALGNSLNIPAIKTVHFTGEPDFLQFLRRAGFTSLDKPSSHYGEGLALGNGEVTLLELVRAYTALAYRGVLRPLRVIRKSKSQELGSNSVQLTSPEVSSVISNILSDPNARRLEFGSQGLLRLPVQTAIKTGTSSDYRDAWAIGYSNNYVVGVWLGNLNRSSMREISGARGPALVLRSIFAVLERLQESRDLYLSPRLSRAPICPISGLKASRYCPSVDEVFIPGSDPHETCKEQHNLTSQVNESANQGPQVPVIRILTPTQNLNLALDPRIPDSAEAFRFELESSHTLTEVTWVIDGKEAGQLKGDIRNYLWQLERGHHVVQARARTKNSDDLLETEQVDFYVR